MGCNGTYGDNTTLIAAAHLFEIQIVVISSLGQQGTRLVSKDPEYMEYMITIFIGHIAEGQGEHYVSLNVPENCDIKRFLSVSTNDGSYFLLFFSIIHYASKIWMKK